MVSHVSVYALVMFALFVGTPAQRSPYLGSSDPGVLPQYLPEGSDNRFGESETPYVPPKIQAGTLETEDVYNRVSQWPDAHKPFWYLNSVAIQKQREQEQQQAAAQAAQAARNQNRQSPFAAGSTRNTNNRPVSN